MELGRSRQAVSRATRARRARPRCEIACFSVGRHLGERAPVAVGGDEHRVVAEPAVTRRGSSAMWPSTVPSATELGRRRATAAPARSGTGRSRSAASSRAEPVQLGQQQRDVVGVGRRRRPRTGPSAHRAHRRARPPPAPSRRPAPTSPVAVASATALSRALSTKVSPSSTTSGTSGGRGTTLDRRAPDSSAASSAAFLGLAEATTIRSGSVHVGAAQRPKVRGDGGSAT